MPFFAPCLGIIGGYLKRNKIPVFGIVDNAIAHEKRLGDTMLVNYFLNKCDSHFTLSDKVKKDINKINNRVSVESLFHPIYNTYSKITDRASALKSLNLKEGKYILFFGLIRKYKGLDLAIRAMSNKLIVEKNIKLIIAGEFYDSEDRYQNLIRDLSLNNIIIYNQFIANKQVPDFFSVSNLVILPYTSATQSGVTQLAMYYNKPMLVTNVGGLPEIIDHKKDGYISSTNPEEMSEYILDYFSQDNKEKEMSFAISKKHDSYSWDNFVKKIIK
jgi:glycosyltransferase involved in cell wall biosynthesis